MNQEKDIFLTPVRLMCLFAFLVLTVASFISFNHTPTHISVIPKPEITIFLINSISALLCLALVFFPSNWQGQVTILFIQSISTTLTGYDTLGTFLYAAFVILCFVNGFFKTNAKTKITAFIIVWILVLVGYAFFIMLNKDILSNKGYYRIALECTISVFFFGFYYYVYKRLESLLVTLMPAKPMINTTVDLPKPGDELHLSNYGLTERQINLILEYLRTNKSYEALSEQFFISKSTVKKDMTEVFEKFGVPSMKELHILLLQYIVKA